MARRTVGRQRIIRGPTRDTVWVAGPPSNTTITAASTASVVAFFSAEALALRPFTIVRTRGNIYVRSDQAAATEVYGCGYGMAIVSEQASAIGITAVPTPVTDFESDLFFVIEQIQGRFLFSDATGIREVGQHRVIDSKAMRKVSVDEDLVVSAETTSFQSSALITDSFRILLKLH